MDCIIPGNNMKVINKALTALSKISDELYIECTPENFSLISMNMNKTVFTKYNFQPLFFIVYEVQDAENQPGVTCKIYVKSLMGIFKQRMERKVETCRLQIEKDASKIDVRLKYKHDVTIMHKLKLIDQDYLTINYSIDDTKNVLSGSGNFFAQVLSNFQQSDQNLSFQVNKGKLFLWNYDISTEAVYKGIRSQVSLTSNEFINYKIGEETSLVMSLKPFRTAVGFTEHFNLNLDLHFKGGGWPIIAVIKSSTFDVTYVLSTVNPDGSIGSTASTNIADANKRRRDEESMNNLTAQDREILENIDWDNDNLDSFTTDKGGGERTQTESDLFSTEKDLDEDVVLGSPEVKVAKVFGRCFEPTMHASMINFGDTLAGNSDSDDD